MEKHQAKLLAIQGGEPSELSTEEPGDNRPDKPGKHGIVNGVVAVRGPREVGLKALRLWAGEVQRVRITQVPEPEERLRSPE